MDIPVIENLTSKHFELVAAVLACTPRVEETSREVLAEAFAESFARCNPSFDRERFVRACFSYSR